MIGDDVIFELISVSMVSSIISTQVIQKTKDIFLFCSICNKIMSVFISFFIGFIYSQSFYTKDFLLSFWIGLFTLVGSENFYKTFKENKEKIFFKEK